MRDVASVTEEKPRGPRSLQAWALWIYVPEKASSIAKTILRNPSFILNIASIIDHIYRYFTARQTYRRRLVRNRNSCRSFRNRLRGMPIATHYQRPWPERVGGGHYAINFRHWHRLHSGDQGLLFHQITRPSILKHIQQCHRNPNGSYANTYTMKGPFAWRLRVTRAVCTGGS